MTNPKPQSRSERLETSYDAAYCKVLEPWRSKGQGYGSTEISLAHRAGLDAVAALAVSEMGRTQWAAVEGAPGPSNRTHDFLKTDGYQPIYYAKDGKQWYAIALPPLPEAPK